MKPDGVRQHLARFAGVRVAVIGDLVADHYLFGQTERVSREAPVLIVRHERDEVRLGGAANVAANARALGAQVTAVGLLGRDDMGQAMRRLFRQHGIGVRAVDRDVTETKTRVLAGGVNTTRQQMLRIDRGGAEAPSLAQRGSLVRQVRAAVAAADVVVVSDYGAGVVNDETRAVLREAAAEGTTVCVDSRFGLRDAVGFSVCKPNEPELAALTGLPVGTDAQLTRAAALALEMLQCHVLLVTRGRHGMAVFSRSAKPTFLPVWGQHDAVDVTGAGDTVSAAFAVALGAKTPASRAAFLANVAGGLVVQKQGTATVSLAELRAAV
ncbi:MAG: bifunctional hydroxymethylpyrimidine kinase/phosphomethylpyrimidine kinase [Archangium sp.]|nr:bifunctional hydroxymethylpyrimidine kinase/phosphomethylpyrimidine kinase [Archangium sp.]